MQPTRPLQFGHDDRQEIYQFVEQRGVVEHSEIAVGLDLDPTAIRHHVAILKRDGLLEADDGTLRVGLEVGSVEEREADGVPYQIRAARQEDLGGIIGVIREVVAAGTYVEAESVAQLIDHEEVLLRFNEHGSRMFFVATVEDDVVGWVHIAGSTLEKLDHTAKLTTGIIEAYRNHGIGSHLLSRGLEWASSRGFARVYQSVPATNERAIAFLESHGWSIEAIREDHYRIDGEDIDEVMLAMSL